MANTVNEKTFTLERPDGARLAAYHWSAGKAKAVVVVAHGMGEHARRYPPALAQLLDNGFDLYGIDHRGHGETMALCNTEAGEFGGGGFASVVTDLFSLVRLARKENPGLPLILLGHSMGSFISQAFAIDYSESIDALVLVGTTAVDQLAESVKLESDILSALNRGFEPARTSCDWLSADEKEVDAYIDDPLCGFSLNLESMASLLSQGARLACSIELDKIRKSLPVYVVVGSLDPLGGRFGSVSSVVERYRSAGLAPTFVSYPQGRHEILNEVNRGEVVRNLLGWLEYVV